MNRIKLLQCDLNQIVNESNQEWRIESNRESKSESRIEVMEFATVSLRIVVNREVFNTIRQYESADPGEHYASAWGAAWGGAASLLGVLLLGGFSQVT